MLELVGIGSKFKFKGKLDLVGAEYDPSLTGIDYRMSGVRKRKRR
jgi:hypothetical protein